MSTYNNSKLLTNFIRSFNTTSVKFASHYDALGLTPKATQSDIKSAYYKLSMLYHPDKSNDRDSALKFRAITEAYEVLGNINLKKLYDKGLMVGKENKSRMNPQQYHPEPEPTDPTLKFYKSHEFRHVMPTMDGRRPVYDFDTWSKQHYGTMLNKNIYDKKMSKILQQKREHAKESLQQAYFFSTAILVVMAACMLFMNNPDYDVDTTSKKADYLKTVSSKPDDSLEK